MQAPNELKKDLAAFIEETNLVPCIVYDGIAEEVLDYLQKTPSLASKCGAVSAELNNRDTLSSMERRTVSVYRSNEVLQVKFQSDSGRDYYYAFMRTWVAAHLKAALDLDLPDSFKLGSPSPSIPEADNPAFVF